MCAASFGIYVVFGFSSGITIKAANTQTTNIDSAETVTWIESHPVNLRPRFGIPEVPQGSESGWQTCNLSGNCGLFLQTESKAPMQNPARSPA